ncbi:MAG: sigma-54 dependent transcriptional regulator [Candidatus Competibacteraceae bacterium]
MIPHLLIVEDDAALNLALTLHFEEQGFRVTRAHRIQEALAALATCPPDAALLDQQLPDGTGLELLGQLLAREPGVPVIMMTGARDLDLAIRAIQQGAYDFVYKPLQTQELELTLARALQHRQLVQKAGALGDDPTPPAVSGTMLGQSRALLAVSKDIALVAPSDARVLITGESGVGKEMVARAIHHHSGRPGSFLAVNCAAIVDTLLESELFGHEKGAFTGAVACRPGKFELADEGTLFLDEVGELAPGLQAKLLRVLQEEVFERVGGTQPLTSRARVIAATHRDLPAEVRAGRFREDLFYRLNTYAIPMPPLRERRDDIPLLVAGLMERIARSLQRPPLKMTETALARLCQYDWPGNVRELVNVLTQALVRARYPVLTPDLLSLPDRPSAPAAATDGPLLSLDEVEALHVQRVLATTGGHKGHACDILKISRPALDRKIQKYQLQLPAGGDE